MAKKSKKSHAFAAVTTFDFPPEIEYVIFEWAARMFPGDAATLSVLCRRIQPQVESIMYESLLIAPGYSSQGLDLARDKRILPTLMSRPSTFFAAYTRNLCIRQAVPLDIARIVLSKCTAIRHLAITLEGDGYAPMLALTAHTLVSLNIARHIARDVAQCGIVFPNLLFLTLQHYPFTVRVQPLYWIPSVKTVLLELGRFPLTDEGWMQDIETVLSAPRLQSLMLNASKSVMPDAKKYIKGRNIAKHIKTVFSNNLYMEEEWRKLYRGKDCF